MDKATALSIVWHALKNVELLDEDREYLDEAWKYIEDKLS